MTFYEMETILMEHLRLYHHPVAVTWLFNEEELEAFKKGTEHVVPVKPLTFCQLETAARMQGRTVLAEEHNMACLSARIAFGWAEINEQEVRNHLKYCVDEAQTRRFLLSRPRLPMNSLRALAVGPLSKAPAVPHVVHFYCDVIQAYHLAVDYMAALDVHPVRGQICMTSAACGGTVFAWRQQAFNYSTMCSGSYNAGKTERGECYVFIPGSHLEAVVRRLQERIRAGGSSSVTRPGDYFPGADVCKNCPLVAFKKDPDATCEACSPV